MQAVILAGGLGVRMYPITRDTPKSMIQVASKPFLEYQLDVLKKNCVLDVVLCIGHMGNQIREYFRDGSEFGVHIRYSEDNEAGTGGALKLAEALLDERFFLMWGDSFVPIDLQPIMDLLDSRNGIGVMVIFENHDDYDKSNIVKDGAFVGIYDKTGKYSDELSYIDSGISLLRRELLTQIPANKHCSLEEEVFPRLAGERQLLAFETSQRFYEIGSPNGLRDFEAYVRRA